MLEEGQLLLKEAGVKAAESDLDSNFLELVLKAMQSDDISTTVKSDSLPLLLGKGLFEKLGRMRAGDVRSQLRNIARLKLEIQKVAKLPMAQLAEVIQANLYDQCIKAIKSLCGISLELNLNGAMMFNKPSLVLKIGPLLSKVAALKRGHTIRQHDEQAKTDVHAFIYLHKSRVERHIPPDLVTEEV